MLFNDNIVETEDCIMCPYCRYNQDDIWDYVDNKTEGEFKMDCQNCDEEFNVSFFAVTIFNSEKIGD